MTTNVESATGSEIHAAAPTISRRASSAARAAAARGATSSCPEPVTKAASTGPTDKVGRATIGPAGNVTTAAVPTRTSGTVNLTLDGILVMMSAKVLEEWKSTTPTKTSRPSPARGASMTGPSGKRTRASQLLVVASTSSCPEPATKAAGMEPTNKVGRATATPAGNATTAAVPDSTSGTIQITQHGILVVMSAVLIAAFISTTRTKTSLQSPARGASGPGPSGKRTRPSRSRVRAR